MKILETLLVSVIATSSLLELAALTHKGGLSVTTTIALGQEKDAAQKTPAVPLAIACEKKDGYIGLRLKNNLIVQVFGASPADLSGLTVGDKILDINDRTTYGNTVRQIADKLTGPIGTSVDVIVEHGDELRKLSFVRQLPVPEELTAIEAQKRVDLENANNADHQP